jgi:amino acid adenylation domain-containing protein/non-ribosomal peptide synthase protein (TIGR01720 family)
MNENKTIVDLLALALDKGISVFLDNNEVKVKLVKSNSLPQDIIELLTKNKAAIKQFLINETEVVDESSQIKVPGFCMDRRILDKPPLSFSQQSLWIVDMIQENSIQFNMPTVLTFKGQLEKEKLAYAFQQVINRHEVLRTVFNIEEGVPYQSVLPRDTWQMSYSENQQLKNTDILHALVREYGHKPFNLAMDHMLRAQLIKVDTDEYVIVLVFHHIAIDGWSMSIFVRELIEFYRSDMGQKSVNLPLLLLQYKDYAIWQKTYFTDERLSKELKYWEAKLSGLVPLNLPTDFSRPAIMSNKGATEGIYFDKELTGQLKDFAAKKKVTLFMLLLSAFKVLLYRYSCQEDICVGTLVANRNHKELENLIGYFPNSLPLRSNMKDNPVFEDFLLQVKETFLEAFANLNAPFEKIVDRVERSRDMSRSALFQVMFLFMNDAEPEINLDNGNFSIDHFKYEPAKFDLTFYLNETADGLSLDMIYCSDLFSAERVKRLLQHFSTLLKGILKNPAVRIGNLPLLEQREMNQILFDFNNTSRPYPKEKTILDIFTEQVSINPDAIAVVFKDVALTYNELNSRANQLANLLVKKGIDTESPVCVCMNRSHSLLISILAVMKAGGVYIPIDPEYPQVRLEYIIGDSKADIIITETESDWFDFSSGCELIILDRDKEIINQQPVSNIDLHTGPGNLAYVIYTSGSTGNPKGAMIEHKGMLNHLYVKVEELSIDETSKVLQNASQSFDISIWQFLVALVKGGTTFIYPQEIILDTKLFLEKISSDQLTHVEVVPSYLRVLLEDEHHKQLLLPYLKCLLVTGETLPKPLTGKWFERFPNTLMVNAYGPTEASDDITHFIMNQPPEQEQVPIGHVLANMQVYVFNQYMEMCPIGVPGEIGVAGIGVGRGYINNNPLTKDKFITNPFDKKSDYKLYLTGDTGFWMSDGNLAFIGRKDDQVKIRGHRIELGEIEAKLNASVLVSQSCVIVKQESSGAKSLIAYFVPNRDEIKANEEDLCKARISTWKELYNIEYTNTGPEPQEFDINGWKDSFTNKLIPAVEMEEWLADTIEIIMEGKPKRVFEIGCGTGLLFYRIADKVEQYTGTDFCAASINKIQQKLNKNERQYCKTKFSADAAHEIAVNKDEVFDTVILNSVVQYFSGERYLLDVLDRSISILNGSGRIIIGDVRDNRLLKLFKSKLLLSKLQDGTSVNDFEWTRDLETANEEELCISPEFFYNLKSIYPSISHVDIKWKNGSAVNELTAYRYMVVIYVGVKKEWLQCEWQQWKIVKSGRSLIELIDRQENTIALKGMPNPRLFYDRSLTEGLLTNTLVRTVGELKNFIDQPNAEKNQINELLLYAQSKGYSYRLLLNEAPLDVNLLLELTPSSGFIKQMSIAEVNTDSLALINMPIFRDFHSLVQEQLSTNLKKQLPEYMVPSGFVALQYLPLTGNGKINRKFLIDRDLLHTRNTANFHPTRNEVEEKLARIWSELLGIKQVGIYDNFFESGGDSILVIQFVSRATKEGLHLQPKDIFEYQTIAALAAIIGEQPAEKSAEQGILTGGSLLLPHQQRFLNYGYTSISHCNQAALFQICKNTDPHLLDKVVKQLTDHHDALRFIFSKSADGWKQSYQPYTGKLEIIEPDLFNYDFAVKIKNICESYQRSLNIETGELARFVLIKTPGTEEYNRLFIVVHNLVLDDSSWKILLDQLEENLNVLEKGETIIQELKTLSFRNYTDAFFKQPAFNTIENQLPYWQSVMHQYLPLPPDKWVDKTITSTEICTRTFCLNAASTSSLLNEVGKLYGTTIEDTILFVLAKVITSWSGNSKILIGIEKHGREILPGNVDITNTVGCFNYSFPVLLEVSPGNTLSDQLKEVKEQLRSVPANGVGYGMLDSMKRDNQHKLLSESEKWDVDFKFSSLTENKYKNRCRLKPAREEYGKCISDDFIPLSKWQFECEVTDGKLYTSWSYLGIEYSGDTIDSLIKKIYQNFETVIRHCKDKTGKEFTPSDYGLQGIISKEEFEEFSESYSTEGVDILKF